MKTKIEWELSIVKITNIINEKFPELSKYILEMPVEDSGNDDIKIKNLEDYYYSLVGFLNKYAETHISEIDK
ncbi:MAG: hypothetical protein ACI9A7_002473 [Cyclobacteriaceae bacterium]|jgi:hypothetical protein